MAKFLTTSETTASVEAIIRNAKSSLVLISPYLQLSRIVFERLKHADEKGVEITIVYGKDELKQEVKDMLAQLKNLKLHFYQHLHAKCYYNEQQLIITSMNLFEFSDKNNREMGVLLEKEVDPAIYSEALEEADAILKQSRSVSVGVYKGEKAEVFSFSYQSTSNWNSKQSSNSSWSNQNGRNSIRSGSCIRCSTDIDFDPSRPFCYNCFQTWASFGNPHYNENYCHECAKPVVTSKSAPLCWNCSH